MTTARPVKHFSHGLNNKQSLESIKILALLKLFEYIKDLERKTEGRQKKEEPKQRTRNSQPLLSNKYPGSKLAVKGSEQKSAHYAANLSTHKSSGTISEIFNGFKLQARAPYLHTEQESDNLPHERIPSDSTRYQTSFHNVKSEVMKIPSFDQVKSDKRFNVNGTHMIKQNIYSRQVNQKKHLMDNSKHMKSGEESVPKSTKIRKPSKTKTNPLPPRPRIKSRIESKMKKKNKTEYIDNEHIDSEYEALSMLLNQTLHILKEKHNEDKFEKVQKEVSTNKPTTIPKPEVIDVNIWNNIKGKLNLRGTKPMLKETFKKIRMEQNKTNKFVSVPKLNRNRFQFR